MEFEQLIRERYSVRKYRSDPIGEETLTRILEAGNVAPTGVNAQPQRIYVLKSPEALKKIRSLTRCAFDAPVVLLIACNEDEMWKNPFEAGVSAGQQDVSIVATHIMLAAWNLGVGSCWVNYFPNSKVAAAFSLPGNERPVLLMPLGYPAEDAKPSRAHFDKKLLARTVTVL